MWCWVEPLFCHHKEKRISYRADIHTSTLSSARGKKDHAHFSKYVASVTSHTCQQQNHMSMAKSWLVGTGCKIIMPESVMLLRRPDESVVSTQLGTVHEESLRKLLYG